jgi:hypothetical protein
VVAAQNENYLIDVDNGQVGACGCMWVYVVCVCVRVCVCVFVCVCGWVGV